MKIKKERKLIFVIAIILIIGYLGLSIYQLIKSEFDMLNIIMLFFAVDTIVNCFEKK